MTTESPIHISKIRNALECAEIFAIKNADQRSAGKRLTILQAAKIELIAMGDASARKDEGTQHVSDAVDSRTTSPANLRCGEISDNAYNAAVKELEYCNPGELGIKLAAVFRALRTTEPDNEKEISRLKCELAAALLSAKSWEEKATEPVSIEAAAKAIYLNDRCGATLQRWDLWENLNDGRESIYRKRAKAAFDAAGVKYHD